MPRHREQQSAVLMRTPVVLPACNSFVAYHTPMPRQEFPVNHHLLRRRWMVVQHAASPSSGIKRISSR